MMILGRERVTSESLRLGSGRSSLRLGGNRHRAAARNCKVSGGTCLASKSGGAEPGERSQRRCWSTSSTDTRPGPPRPNTTVPVRVRRWCSADDNGDERS
eukprot:1119208-Rhodomonas_salina.2